MFFSNWARDGTGIWMWKSVRVQLMLMGTTIGIEKKIHVKGHREGLSPGCSDCRSYGQSHSCSPSSLSPSHTNKATDGARSTRDIGLMSLPCILQYLDSHDEMSFQAKRSYTRNSECIILYINFSPAM